MYMQIRGEMMEHLIHNQDKDLIEDLFQKTMRKYSIKNESSA